jgi:predicted nucleic acid-binding protein
MREFFDTSVLVAAFWNGHVHHRPSVTRLGAANKKQSACGVHSLAEVYAVMTALPVKPLIPPEQALLFVEDVRNHLTVVPLNGEECFAAIQRTAGLSFGSGRVYDALLLACAAKVRAETIYTWNLKHYQSLAPELSAQICTP